ncbi:iron-containing alcohol dehydrogenase [Mangrovibacterium sp.]|uniref:iron-containing alcohol dehydrogenase n=1 Tax=Mangrovibacterium sp. TaxID=1961364 RepID=UPI00356A176F
MITFDFHIPTKILFGAGKLNQLATEKLPGKKALIVISAGQSMHRFGYLKRVQTLLDQQNIQSVVFDKILPNPIKDHVMEGAQIARDNACDFIIGLGGGSSIDSAKSIAIMTVNPGDYWDYVHGGTGKGQPIKNGALPIVAITTTAGTGTEADPWTVISNGNEKIGYGDVSCTFPVLSVVDPELMVSVPPLLTAYQGFDAFFHAAEGYIANVANPISDLYALESIRLIARYLPIVVADGSDIEARGKVAWANTLSGLVESTSSCTSEHSLEHALSARNSDLAHGAGLIILSEAYFSHFSDKIPGRLKDMARAMGKDDFIEALTELQKKCGVHDLKLSDYGILESELPELALNARRTMGGLYQVDPVPLSDQDAEKILRNSFS